MDEEEYLKRCHHWNSEDLSPDRVLGRLEGQQMIAERFLYWLDVLGASCEEAAGMVRADAEQFSVILAMESQLRRLREDRRPPEHHSIVFLLHRRGALHTASLA